MLKARSEASRQKSKDKNIEFLIFDAKLRFALLASLRSAIFSKKSKRKTNWSLYSQGVKSIFFILKRTLNRIVVDHSRWRGCCPRWRAGGEISFWFARWTRPKWSARRRAARSTSSWCPDGPSCPTSSDTTTRPRLASRTSRHILIIQINNFWRINKKKGLTYVGKVIN